MQTQDTLNNYLKAQVKSYGDNTISKDGKLRFDLTESSFGPTPKLKNFLKNLDYTTLIHYPEPNPILLKETISKNFSINTKNISIGNGVSDFIDRISNTFLDTKRSILVLTPTFFRFIESAKRLGSNVYEISTQEDEMFTLTEIVVNSWFQVIKEKQPDVIWLCNPNNPTGKILPSEFIKQTLKVSQKLVVIDEVNFELIEKEQTSSINLVESVNNLVVLRSLSKIYGLAGIRFGFAIASEPIAKLLEKMRSRHLVATLVRDIAQIAINDQNYIKEKVGAMTKEITMFKNGLKKFKSIKSITDSNTNLFILTLENGNLLNELDKFGVIATDLFGSNGIGDKNFVRISLRDQNMNLKLLHILKEIDKSFS